MKKTNLILLVVTSLLVSCSSMKPKVNEADINAEAVKAYAEIKAKSKISTNKEWTAMVNRVADRIAKASGENFQWEVVLIDSPEVNAWCMPGGKMAVYTGIMPVLKSEGALAAVMGHEVAHATLRHGMEGYIRAKQQSYAGVIIAGASVIGGQLLCKTEDCKKWSALGGVAAGFALTFLDRKFSRADETSADKKGQIYMAKAGYDPAEAIVLWDRMNAGKQGAAPPEFVSTHPSDQTRKNNLKSWLPEAEAVYAQSPQKYGLGATIR
ncbi:M48 family metallopeptidase [Bdellovibrio sp. HCB274]|uniref:M48 family metallopeptidase n=1 Tax=Bdellovibrio sp. HCB274 TaxID=3394361 RepID=UPI0039B45A53